MLSGIALQVVTQKLEGKKKKQTLSIKIYMVVKNERVRIKYHKIKAVIIGKLIKLHLHQENRMKIKTFY